MMGRGCTFCGESTATGGAPELRLQVVAYPYNPEWPLEIREAAVFCTATCLIDYVNQREGRT